MKKNKPIIKFNGGSPVALCNRCFIIMCNVKCDIKKENTYVITNIHGDKDSNFISSSIGDTPPVYCDKCANLLTYSINE